MQSADNLLNLQYYQYTSIVLPTGGPSR